MTSYRVDLRTRWYTVTHIPGGWPEDHTPVAQYTASRACPGLPVWKVERTGPSGNPLGPVGYYCDSDLPAEYRRTAGRPRLRRHQRKGIAMAKHLARRAAPHTSASTVDRVRSKAELARQDRRGRELDGLARLMRERVSLTPSPVLPPLHKIAASRTGTP